MTIADDTIPLLFPSGADDHRPTEGRAGHVPRASSRRSAVQELNDLARRGELATHAAAAPGVRARLTGAAYDIVWPIVFARITRPMERRRGHWSCAVSVRMLADECLDRFHDDVEAVVTDLLAGAKVPIADVERWVSARLTAATVDGHRRRRGGRGALQRPRVPVWLAAELGGDPWLTDLAVQILTWVGVPATAGTQLWPLDSWAQRRELVTGDAGGGDEATVAREVELVLTAMRRRPKWHADYVERPLGHKWAPVVAVPGDAVGDPPPLLVVGPEERDDTRLSELASAAVEAMSRLLRTGADPADTVVRVLGLVFAAGTGSEEIDRTPGRLPVTGEWVSALLTDAGAVQRIVGEMLRIIGETRC